MSTTAETTGPNPDLHLDIRRNREMSLGFGLGSILFGTGAVAAMAGAPSSTANVLFALGAVGFTAAALVQLISANAHFPAGPQTWRRAVRDPDLVSSLIQFIGTVEFNVMTLRAVFLPPTAANYEMVWRPDVVGSACFLISSWIAWHPIARARRHSLVSERSHVILWANMAGSLFFAVSAWGAMLVGHQVTEIQSELWNNLGTLLGAVGFLVAAVLLWPRPEASYARS